MTRTLGNIMKKARCLLPGIIGCIFISGCSNETEEEQVGADPEWVEPLTEAQERFGLSDGEMEVAIERWIKFVDVWNDAIESGIIDEEQLADFPAMAEELLAEQGAKNGLQAVYSLAHLSALNHDRVDEVRESLHRIISDHYRFGKAMGDKDYDAFAEKAEKVAEGDPELKRLLDEIKNGQQGEAQNPSTD